MTTLEDKSINLEELTPEEREGCVRFAAEELKKKKQREGSRKWYENNKEKSLESSRQSKARNPERTRELARGYARAEREDPVIRKQQAERSLAYYYANREKALSKQRQRRKDNPEKTKEQNRRYLKNAKEKDPEKFKRRVRESFLRNREAKNARRRERYYADHEEVKRKAREQSRAANPRSKKNTKYKTKYGLTLEQVEAMIEAQGECARYVGSLRKVRVITVSYT